MATQYIKFKRSAIPGKRPSNSQMELGELALNTNDGRLFTKKENVGIGTTVTLLNVWTENVGGGAYYTDGNIGIGTTNPITQLHLSGFSTTNSNLKIGSLEFQNYSLNNSFFGDNVYWNGSAMVRRSTGAAGLFYFFNDEGQFRLSPVGLANSETVNSPQLKINSNGSFGVGVSISQNPNNFTGSNFYVSPQGNTLIGSISSTGTASQRLQVTGGAYVSGSVGIGTTNPIEKLDINGNIRVSSGSTFVFGTGPGLGATSSGYTYALSNPFTSVQIGGIAGRTGNALVDIRASNYPDATNVINIQTTSETYTGTIGTYKPFTPAGTVIELGNTRSNDRIGLGNTQFGASGALVSIYAYNNNSVTNAFFGAVAGNVSNGPANFVFGRRTGAFSWEETVRIDTSGNLGIGTTNPTSRLQVQGDALVTGVVTATAFNGNINAGIGTITNLSGTNVSYSGIGTIGTLDVNSADIDNLNTINISNSGIITTSNLVVNDEFDVYATDSTFHDNVVIQGNLTVNGTQVILNVDDKFIKDKQIVLGFSTTNDVDDTTANGGGFGIASTEGSPLVCLQCTGINTLPSTYKQLIWTKANTFGAGTTDAFLFNYAVGIGSTLVPNGVRLSVGGVKITDSDVNATTFTGSGANLTSLNASNISSGTLDNARLPQNISVSGIITATTFSGNLQNTLTLNTSGTGLSGSATFNNSSSSTFTVTSNATSNNTGGTIVARNANGGFSAGIVTATFVGNVTGNLNSSGVNTAATLSGTTLTYTTGSITNVSGTNLNYTGISTITNVRSTTINNTGVGTITTLNSTTGTITNLSGTNVSYSGIGTVGSLNIGSTQVISSARQLQNIASLDATTTATIETAIANAPNTFTDLQVTGLSTFTNGPVLIGSGTSTGVSEQRLQVTGGAYISGSLGIGTTAPRDQGTLEVVSTIPGGGIRVSSFGTNSPGFRLVNNETGENAQNLLALSTGAGLINSRPGDYIIRNNAGGSIIFGLNQLGISTTGFVRITPNSELLVGSSSSITTGTLGQNLQVTGGAYISDNTGIGTTNPTSKLTVQGDVLVSGVITSTDYNCSSDINLKENIQPIENPIDKVLNITGVSFDWKEDGRSSMGVIAQEVERVLPELVSGSDTKTVNYNGLIGLLIEVVKEQQQRINTLEERFK
jgi:hypothetical protein